MLPPECSHTPFQVFLNDAQRAKSRCVPRFAVGAPGECRTRCVGHGAACLGWTATPNNHSSYNCTLTCGVVPLLAVSGLDCNWAVSAPTGSVAGMIGGWGSVYMERSRSSLVTSKDLQFPYGGLVRLLDSETEGALSVFVDKSIVEVFAMGGAGATHRSCVPVAGGCGRRGRLRERGNRERGGLGNGPGGKVAAGSPKRRPGPGPGAPARPVPCGA